MCFNLQCLNPALINQNCASLFMSRKTCIVTGIQLDLPSGIPSVLLLPPTTSFIKGSYKRGFDKRPLITTRTRFFLFLLLPLKKNHIVEPDFQCTNDVTCTGLTRALPITEQHSMCRVSNKEYHHLQCSKVSQSTLRLVYLQG